MDEKEIWMGLNAEIVARAGNTLPKATGTRSWSDAAST